MFPFDVHWAAPLRRALKAGWLALPLALLLGACSVITVQPGTALTPGPDEGIVVFSITRTGDRTFDWWPELKGPGLGSGRALVMYADHRTQDWPGGPGMYSTPADVPVGHLMVLRLLPGTYRIDRWWGQALKGGMWGIGYKVEASGLGLSFTVQPGAVTYLGNVNFVFPDQLNYRANISEAPYRVETSLQSQRDLAMLHKKFGLSADQVRTEPMHFAPAGPLRYYLYNYQEGSSDRD